MFTVPKAISTQSAGMWGGWDGGDGLSQINPEDIESINILKGSNVMLTDEKSHNRPPAGYYLNPVLCTYQFPRQMDFNNYWDNYEYLDPARNVMLQNVYINNHFISNPHWILQNQPRDNKTKRAIGNVAVSWDISEKLNFSVRGNYDFAIKSREQQHAAGSNTTNVHANGAWDYSKFTDELMYTDGFFKYDNSFGDIRFNLLAGASYQKTTYGLGTSVNTGTNGLLYANEFISRTFRIMYR